MLDKELLEKMLKEKKEARQNERSDTILLLFALALSGSWCALGVGMWLGWIVLP